MSLYQMAAAWRVTCATHTQKLVLVALADNADDFGRCWPSITTIADRCNLSRQSVLDQTRDLELAGWLKISRGTGRSNHYQLALPVNGVDQQPVNPIDPSTALTSPPRLPPVVNGVDHRESTALTAPVYGVDSNSKEPSVEPSVEQSPMEKGVKVSADEFAEVWNTLPAGFPKVKSMTDARKSALRVRLGDSFWAKNWRTAISRIPSIPWMSGSGNRQWFANVDWFLKPGPVAQIMEHEEPAVGPNQFTGTRHEQAAKLHQQTNAKYNF